MTLLVIPSVIGRTVSRFLFYSVIYLLDLPPGKGRVTLLPLRTFRYTWSFWFWCRHRHMSPHDVVSSCLAVSPLPLRAVCFLLRLAKDYSHLCFPQQNTLPSPDFPLKFSFSDRSFYLYLFLVAEFALELVVLCIDLCNCLFKSRSDILA